jgi:hypothetical protein
VVTQRIANPAEYSEKTKALASNPYQDKRATEREPDTTPLAFKNQAIAAPNAT